MSEGSSSSIVAVVVVVVAAAVVVIIVIIMKILELLMIKNVRVALYAFYLATTTTPRSPHAAENLLPKKSFLPRSLNRSWFLVSSSACMPQQASMVPTTACSAWDVFSRSPSTETSDCHSFPTSSHVRLCNSAEP